MVGNANTVMKWTENNAKEDAGHVGASNTCLRHAQQRTARAATRKAPQGLHLLQDQRLRQHQRWQRWRRRAPHPIPPAPTSPTPSATPASQSAAPTSSSTTGPASSGAAANEGDLRDLLREANSMLKELRQIRMITAKDVEATARSLGMETVTGRSGLLDSGASHA